MNPPKFRDTSNPKNHRQTMEQYKTDSLVYKEMKVKKRDLTEEPGNRKILLLILVVIIVMYLFGLDGFKGKGPLLLLVCVDLDSGT